MKIVALSNAETVRESYHEARAQGYIVFIYEHADPLHSLSAEKFVYVLSDEELVEKISLLRADSCAVEEIARW